MSFITIILFFLYTYGLGFSVTYFFKNSDNFFERNIMRAGIGLGTIPFLLSLFNFLHIPIDWKIILAVSLIIPFYSLVNLRKVGITLPKIKFSKSNLYFLLVFIIFLII